MMPRDVIELPSPYNKMISDDVKRWERTISRQEVLDPQEKGNEVLATIDFTNALVLKLNQLSKQGLIDRRCIFCFACYISSYDIIGEVDRKKCMASFFNFARQLVAIRDGIKSNEQKVMFDLEEASWVPPIYVREKYMSRPSTSKPKDPDEYEFTDENVARDYRKLWDQYQELQSLRESESGQK